MKMKAKILTPRQMCELDNEVEFDMVELYEEPFIVVYSIDSRDKEQYIRIGLN